MGDSQPTVSQTLLFEDGRGTVLHVNPEQDEQGEEHEPSHKIDQPTSRMLLLEHSGSFAVGVTAQIALYMVLES